MYLFIYSEATVFLKQHTISTNLTYHTLFVKVKTDYSRHYELVDH